MFGDLLAMRSLPQFLNPTLAAEKHPQTSQKRIGLAVRQENLIRGLRNLNSV